MGQEKTKYSFKKEGAPKKASANGLRLVKSGGKAMLIETNLLVGRAIT